MHLSVLVPVVVTLAFSAQRQPGISVKYESIPEVTLHEPIVVTAIFTNLFDHAVRLDLGQRREANFTLTLEDPTGTPTTVVPHGKSVGGFSTIVSAVSIAAGERYSHGILLNKWFDFPRPGEYHLRIAFRGTADDRSAPILGDGELTIRVGPRDERALRRTCDALLARVVASTPADAGEPATTLAYIDDPIVPDYLRQVIAANRLVDSIAIEGLERLGTDQAKAVLKDATHNPHADTATLALAALQRLESRKRK